MNTRDLHFDAIVVDGHSDTVSRILDYGEDLSKKTAGHIDLPSMFDGGLDAQFFAAFVDPKFHEKHQSIKRVLDMVDTLKTFCAQNPDKIQVAFSAADVRRLNREGKKSCLLCIEGGHAIEDDLHVLRMFHELGVRYMTLTWNNTNNWADSCAETPRHNGLTTFGREVVREMNRLGMLVDISHVHEVTFWAALETTTKPIYASHSSCKNLCGHRRNLNDEQLRAVAKNGGVVCVNYYSAFIDEGFRAQARAISEEEDAEKRRARETLQGESLDKEIERLSNVFYEKENKLEPPPLKVLVDHLVHIRDVAGIDHVGLGSDFDGVPSLPKGMENCTKLPDLTQALADRGFSESDLRKILGENVLRVMDQNGC
jgi:membrane dipeptidase